MKVAASTPVNRSCTHPVASTQPALTGTNPRSTGESNAAPTTCRDTQAMRWCGMALPFSAAGGRKTAAPLPGGESGDIGLPLLRVSVSEYAIMVALSFCLAFEGVGF